MPVLAFGEQIHDCIEQRAGLRSIAFANVTYISIEAAS